MSVCAISRLLEDFLNRFNFNIFLVYVLKRVKSGKMFLSTFTYTLAHVQVNVMLWFM